MIHLFFNIDNVRNHLFLCIKKPSCIEKTKFHKNINYSIKH